MLEDSDADEGPTNVASTASPRAGARPFYTREDLSKDAWSLQTIKAVHSQA